MISNMKSQQAPPFTPDISRPTGKEAQASRSLNNLFRIMTTYSEKRSPTHARIEWTATKTGHSAKLYQLSPTSPPATH